MVVMGLPGMSDAGGYLFGTFGKHKLWPKVSPNKTIEGAIGGILFTMLISILTKFLFNLPVSIGYMIKLAFVLAIAGQTGDLFESFLKRKAGVKDSGNWIPQTGGILDRIDSILFGAVSAHLWFYY
jgi:phosphatidate cytidylyltransferase